MLIPELQELHRLFAQIDILHQKLIKFRSRDTLICERILGILTPTPQGVKFGGQKTDSRLQSIIKNKKQQGVNLPARHFVV